MSDANRVYDQFIMLSRYLWPFFFFVLSSTQVRHPTPCKILNAIWLATKKSVKSDTHTCTPAHVTLFLTRTEEIIHTLETKAWQQQTCASQEKYLTGPRTLLSLDGVEQIFVPGIHQEMYHKCEPAFSDSSV